MLTKILVALSLALVPSAEAFSFGGHKFNHKKHPNHGFKVTKKTHTSRARCVATSKTANFAASHSVHVRAIAHVFKHACKLRPGKGYVKKLHDVWVDYDHKSGKAFAFAKAVAATKTTCNSKGNAYGCAAAYAYSSAWAKASAKASAKAWATAIAKCRCNKKFQINAAKSHVYANEHKKLIAKVSALAKSRVCTRKSGGRVSDYDAQTCIQDVYAWVYAKAIAKAAIKGKCVSLKGKKKRLSYGKFVAQALADAEASITIVSKKGCVAKALH